MTAFERSFPPQPAEIAPARAALRAWLRNAGVVGADASADVLVVTSELVTNGVFHDGGGLITLRADRQDHDVSIEVTTVDHLPGQHPTYRDVEDSVDGGRGLEIVHALSHGYRVLRQGHERMTECRVKTTDDDTAPVIPVALRAGIHDWKEIMGDKIGKITEALGHVTGDRKVEAKGRVEQDVVDPDESVEEVTEEAIETEKQVVRGEHGDIDPEHV